MLSRSDRNPTPWASRPVTVSIRCLRLRPQPVQPPHHQRVPGPQLLQRPVQLRTAVHRTGHLLGEHRHAARRPQLIGLQIHRLLSRRHQRVPAQRPHGRQRSGTVCQPYLRHPESATRFWRVRILCNARVPLHPHRRAEYGRYRDRPQGPRQRYQHGAQGLAQRGPSRTNTRCVRQPRALHRDGT